MTEQWDVVIVGAGPAGSMCAAKLAKGGAKVLLIDKMHLPRSKNCTGVISPASVHMIEKEFGAFPEALAVRPRVFKGFKYKLNVKAPFFSTDLAPEEYCFNVWRKDFDYWLAIKASEAGTTVKDDCRFIKYEPCKGGIAVRLCVKSETADTYESVVLKAKYLVAADGMNSLVRRQTFEVDPTLPVYFCRQEYHYATVNLEPGYYYCLRANGAMEDPIWLFHKDGLIVIGMSAYGGEKLQKCRELVYDYLGRTYGFKSSGIVHVECCRENVQYTMTKAKRGNLAFKLAADEIPVLFAGEAAELVDVGGEGIAVALESGGIAAESILSCGDGDTAQRVYREKCGELVATLSQNWLEYAKRFGRYYN